MSSQIIGLGMEKRFRRHRYTAIDGLRMWMLVVRWVSEFTVMACDARFGLMLEQRSWLAFIFAPIHWTVTGFLIHKRLPLHYEQSLKKLVRIDRTRLRRAHCVLEMPILMNVSHLWLSELLWKASMSKSHKFIVASFPDRGIRIAFYRDGMCIKVLHEKTNA